MGVYSIRHAFRDNSINVTVVTIVEDVVNYVTVVLLWIRLNVTLRIGFSCIKLSPYSSEMT